MKKQFRSISWKIWIVIARTIVILVVLALFTNITILKKSKDEFIFNQLKESAKAKRHREQSFIQKGEEGESLWVAHFKIEKFQDSFKVTVDPFTQALYVDKKKDEQIIPRIVERIARKGSYENEGIIKDTMICHYYYVDWDYSGESAMVFLTSTNENTEFQLELFIVILIFLIISFFASRIASKNIAKPIQELEIFAEEISKRNWNAKVPKTDSDEIGLLAQSLEKMRDSLKIAEERDRQFLQSTSHDLKTPVMIIQGYAQAMIDGINLTSEKSAAEIIKIESDRLERKITQLLRLHTIGHTLEYIKNREVVRIDRIIKNLVSKFSIVKPELNWKLDINELEVNGDSESLLIAFENIIENQLRYARNSISISINTEKSEVKISNDGPKFEISNPMELFDTYKKDKEGKFGLGLAIVKQVIQSHGGTISAYNTHSHVEFTIIFRE